MLLAVQWRSVKWGDVEWRVWCAPQDPLRQVWRRVGCREGAHLINLLLALERGQRLHNVPDIVHLRA